MSFYLYLRIFLGQVRIFCKQELGFESFCLTSDIIRGKRDAFVTGICVILFLVISVACT